MAANGSACTPNWSRYFAAAAGSASAGSYTLAVSSPFSSVAAPGDHLAGRVDRCATHALSGAPPMPICIGPAAPKALALLCMPGSVVCSLWLFTVPMPTRIGLGSLIMLANVVLLWCYTLGCHSCRHITAGRLKNFSSHPVRYWMWTKFSWLNARHPAVRLDHARQLDAD